MSEMMKTPFRVRPIDVMVVLAIVGYAGYRSMYRAPKPEAVASTFARQVNLDPLYSTAVQADGRLRSFESHAKTYMGYVTGPRTISGQTNGFTYLDIMFRPERYQEVDLVYVKHKLVLAQILDTLRGHPDMDAQRAARIEKSRMLSLDLLMQPEVAALLQRLGQDLIRTSRPVNAIHSAMTVADSRFLLDNLRLIPPPNADLNRPWLSPLALRNVAGLPRDDVHANVATTTIPGLDSAMQEEIAGAWAALTGAWREENATAVNAQIERLAGLFSRVAPSIYPSPGRLAMESWYFRYNSMTWVWLIYLAAVMPLLMAVVYRWDNARKAGMALFVIAFAMHTVTLIIRWYVSGRWPNSNMFEAVTTTAWFGGVAALVLERITRRTSLRNLFALGSAVMSMAALMAAHFLPTHLDSSIGNKMAALNDVWLYIHTNVIIWSYAVIGMACIPALLLLRHRWCQAWDNKSIPRGRLLLIPVAAAVLNYSGYLLLMHIVDNTNRGLASQTLIGAIVAFWSSLMLLVLEGLAGRDRRAAGAKVDKSASGGASSLILGSGGSGFLNPDKPAMTQVYDGATMVLVELSFIMLWAGLVMGAIWADHSWGRPWGWDPKEVFALNTFLIFLVLIHIRMKVRDRTFWTAVLAVIGFEVMMFNWIVVNFIITGLHSYA